MRPTIEFETRQPASRKSRRQLVFPPAWTFLSEFPDSLHQLRRRRRLSPPVRTPRTVFEALKMLGIVAPPPAIEGLRSDSKMPTGQPSVVAVKAVVVHPLEPGPGLPGELRPVASEPSHSRSHPVDDSHSDTILGVTNVSERVQMQQQRRLDPRSVAHLQCACP